MTNLLWVDLEATGNNPSNPNHQILEFTAILTSEDLCVKSVFSPLFVNVSPEALESMDPVVANMHEQLLQNLSAQVGVSLEELDNELVEFLDENDCSGQLVLAGNTIRMDRSFIMRDLPKLDSRLSHRVVDVSTISELAYRWRPDLHQTAPVKLYAHSSLQDVQESIEELRHYRNSWLR